LEEARDSLRQALQSHPYGRCRVSRTRTVFSHHHRRWALPRHPLSRRLMFHRGPSCAERLQRRGMIELGLDNLQFARLRSTRSLPIFPQPPQISGVVSAQSTRRHVPWSWTRPLGSVVECTCEQINRRCRSRRYRIRATHMEYRVGRMHRTSKRRRPAMSRRRRRRVCTVS
jgi:hypothetical protein